MVNSAQNRRRLACPMGDEGGGGRALLTGEPDGDAGAGGRGRGVVLRGAEYRLRRQAAQLGFQVIPAENG